MKRVLSKRCDECGDIFSVRRPHRASQIARANLLIKCPICFPEHLKDVCGACRLPYALVGHHAQGMCNACVVDLFRYRKTSSATLDAWTNLTSTPATKDVTP